MIKKCVLGLFLSISAALVWGQDIPSIPENRNNDDALSQNQTPTDSSTIVENTFFDIFTGNPGKAALYGLIAPGGGQIYNRKWWKVPIVWGIDGALVYTIYYNTKEYGGYKTAYQNNLRGIEDDSKGTRDVGILKSRRDFYRKTRDYAWIGFILGRVVIIFEGFIDRHLMEFDVSDDLSFQPIQTDLGTFNGITYTIPLSRKKTYEFKNLLE